MFSNLVIGFAFFGLVAFLFCLRAFLRGVVSGYRSAKFRQLNTLRQINHLAFYQNRAIRAATRRRTFYDMLGLSWVAAKWAKEIVAGYEVLYTLNAARATYLEQEAAKKSKVFDEAFSFPLNTPDTIH